MVTTDLKTPVTWAVRLAKTWAFLNIRLAVAYPNRLEGLL